MRIESGQVLHERWRIEHLLGEGGMGYVLAGWDELLERKVAIKSLHGHLASVQQVHDRFLTEAKAMARIDAPQVVSVYDAFDWQGLPVVVMEYVDGETLSSVLARDPMPPLPVVRAVLVGVLRGLRAVHRAGVVHRDVKPDNIMVVRDEEGGVGVRLLDLGVAQVQQEMRHTRTGSVVGTVRYISPEQVRDSARVDARTDLFSVGLVLWEMLSGVQPWAEAEDDFDLRTAVVKQSLPALSPRVPPDLAALVSVLTRKDQAARPDSASTALRLLRGGASSDSRSGAPSGPQEVPGAPAVDRRSPGHFAPPVAAAIVSSHRAPFAPVGNPATVPSTSAPSGEPPARTPSPALTLSPTTRLRIATWLRSARTLLVGALSVLLLFAVAVGALLLLAVAASLWSSHRGELAAARADLERVEAEMHEAERADSERLEAARVAAERALVGETVRVSAGSFVMGSPEGEDGRDTASEAQVEVTLSRDFELGRFPVTQAQYESVMGSNPSHFRSCGGRCPVEMVSWLDAVTFANRVSEELGLPRCYGSEGAVVGGATVYDCEGYRLPTEAEWEYAARAGTRTATYAGAMQILSLRNAPVLDEIAVYAGNSGVTYGGAMDCSGWSERAHEASRCGPKPVGGKRSNAWGFHDMLGNVWEWTDTRFAVAQSGGVDPVGPSEGSGRVLRGGSWLGSARLVRAAVRSGDGPGTRSSSIGFRLARTN